MKKFFMTLAAVAMAATMNAQGYIGGGVGFQSVSCDGNSESAFTIMPEVGYNLDENMAVGMVVGYGESGKDDHKIKKFTIQPYFRYTFAKFDKVNIFADLGLGYTNTKYVNVKNNTFYVGVKPGVAVNLNDKLSFVTHAGFLGWQTSKDDTDGAKAVNTIGLSVDATALSFGLFYNFYNNTNTTNTCNVDINKMWFKSGGSYNNASPADATDSVTANPLQKSHIEVIMDYGRKSMYCTINSVNGSTTSEEVVLEAIPTKFILQCNYNNNDRRSWFDNLKIERIAAGATEPFVPSGIAGVKAAVKADGAIYNLAGQKVGKDYKGLVIMNGKKFVQK